MMPGPYVGKDSLESSISTRMVCVCWDGTNVPDALGHLAAVGFKAQRAFSPLV
jgi:hypothetical protein